MVKYTIDDVLYNFNEKKETFKGNIKFSANAFLTFFVLLLQVSNVQKCKNPCLHGPITRFENPTKR